MNAELRSAAAEVSRLAVTKHRSLVDLRAWQEASDQFERLRAAARERQAAVDPEAIRRESLRGLSKRPQMNGGPWKPEKPRRIVSRTVRIERY